MSDEIHDGYDPNYGDEKRFNDRPVSPLSVLTVQLTGNNNSVDLGDVRGADADRKLLFATVDIQAAGETATASGGVTIEDSDSTTLFTSSGADSEGIDTVNPVDGEETIAVDETLSAVSADNSNSGLVSEVSVYFV